VERALHGGSLEPLPLGEGCGELEQSAEPALGLERVVREPASELGHPSGSCQAGVRGGSLRCPLSPLGAFSVSVT
jgi:hypothetical protein